MSKERIRKPTHPGLLFKRNVLDRMGITVTQAAADLNISRNQLSKFCNGRAPCTVNLAQRIAAAIDSNISVWINLQSAYDTWEAENSKQPEVRKFKAA